MKKQINIPIKAQLLRSAFYVVLLMGVCVIPFALGQRSIGERNALKVAPRTHAWIGHSPLAPATSAPSGDCGIIVNGGFETGALDPWTDTGDTSFTAVINVNQHSGSFALESGPGTSDGLLTRLSRP